MRRVCNLCGDKVLDKKGSFCVIGGETRNGDKQTRQDRADEDPPRPASAGARAGICRAQNQRRQRRVYA